MEFSLKKINNKVIVPIDVGHVKINNILGHEIVPMLNSIIFACGRKGSGKSNIVFKLMEECIDKETNVIVFCSTHNSDKNWKKIKEWLEYRNQPHVFFSSIFEDGHSNIELLIEKIKNDHEREQQELKDKKANKNKKLVKKPVVDLFGDFEEKKPINKPGKKSKMKAPEYFIVLDDISGELRAKKDVQLLLKHHRHLRSKVVISSQFPNDLDPASRAQVDFWCLFKGFGKDRIEEIFPQLDLRDIDFEEFYEIYRKVTTNHNFLYIDRNNNTLRKNFDQEIILTNIKEEDE
jgi:hypothetical protein